MIVFLEIQSILSYFIICRYLYPCNLLNCVIKTQKGLYLSLSFLLFVVSFEFYFFWHVSHNVSYMFCDLQEEYSEHQSSITHCRFSATGHSVATLDVDGVVK